jgi:hypothetical protein
MSLVEIIIGSKLFLQNIFCQIISYALLEHFLLTNALSVWKVKGEGCPPQLLDNCNAQHVLSKYSKSPMGKIMVQNKNHHVNYIYSLFVSVYVVQISTL